MTLNNTVVEKIKSIVYQKPTPISSIASSLGVNWRTADRYVEQIMQRTGTIKTITFREGTRGALKIVYWNNTEKIYSTDVQEKIFKQIEQGIDKSDFSPFDIYQYVSPDKRHAYYEEIDTEKNYNYQIETLAPHFRHAEKEICIFAGNLSFIHLKHDRKTIYHYLKECVDRKIIIKIITNMNLIDMENIDKVLSLNSGLKDHQIEIRHAVTPLRAYIFDSTLVKLGEIKKGPQKEGQIKNTIATYYEIREEDWIEWIQKLFWKNFQEATPSGIRLKNLKSIQKIKNK